MEALGEFKKYAEGPRFSKADFAGTTLVNWNNADYHGLAHTDLMTGQFYDRYAPDMIRRNYVDMVRLSNIFSMTVQSHSAPIAAVMWVRNSPKDEALVSTYDALRDNQYIHIIHFDHLRHTKRSLSSLLSAIAENPHLPLVELTLFSIVLKHGPKQYRPKSQEENWVLSTLIQYLPTILATRQQMSVLSLASNRFGMAATDDQLKTLGQAIANCKRLQSLDLSNNKFSCHQAMLLLEILQSNTSITEFKLSCDGTPPEKSSVAKVVATFLEKNQNILPSVCQRAIVDPEVSIQVPSYL